MQYYNKAITILLHPLILVFLTAYFLIIIDPAHISFENQLLTQNPKVQKQIIASIFVDILILPFVTFLLLWKLGFLKNFKLDTYKSRIIPLIAMITFLFWAWFGMKNIVGINPLITHFLLGLFLSVSIVFLTNPFFRISLPLLGAVQCFAILLQYTKVAHFSFLPVLLIFTVIFTLLLLKKASTKLENPLALLIGLIAQLFVSFL